MAVVLAQICVPDCTYSSPGDKIPDPKNCHNYYVCMTDGTPSDVPFRCDDGQKFDNKTEFDCTDENTAVCAVCPPTCKFICSDSSLSFIADAAQCNKYYLCNGDDILPLNCPPESPYFDGDQCQEDPSMCCDGCSVYCYEAYTEVPDPYNCSNFYFCQGVDYYPETEDLFTCPSGERFDFTLGHCSPNAPCVQPCA